MPVKVQVISSHRNEISAGGFFNTIHPSADSTVPPCGPPTCVFACVPVVANSRARGMLASKNRPC